MFSILILSFDGYSDIWPITLSSFERHWINVNTEANLITNHKIYNSKIINSLQIGDDENWSTNLKKALVTIESDYILTIFDDFLFEENVDFKFVLEYFKIAKKNNFDYLRLQPKPYPDYRVTKLFGRIDEESLYRVSLCNTIIKKQVLNDLLIDGENAWEFEFKGSERSKKYFHFYSTYNRIYKYTNAVEKGKWKKKVVKEVIKKGVDIRVRGIYKERITNFVLISIMKEFILFRMLSPKRRKIFLNIYQKLFKIKSWNR